MLAEGGPSGGQIGGDVGVAVGEVVSVAGQAVGGGQVGVIVGSDQVKGDGDLIQAAASPPVMSSIRSCRTPSVVQATSRAASPVAVSIWK